MSARAGRLRERVKIQAKNLVDNGKGGRMRPVGGPEWTDVATVFAEVLPLRGDEALQHAVLRSVQLYRVTIRARDGVTPAHRLSWRGSALNIKSVAMSPGRGELVMTCEANVPT
ncbi:MAG: phage head closure protein [Burkholderiaceae bacterium]